VRTSINEVLEYAQRPAKQGSSLDTPARREHDRHGAARAGLASQPGAAAGSFPAYRSSGGVELEIYERMKGDIDVDAGRVLSGMTLDEVGEEILSLLLRVARGQRRRRVHRQDVFAIAQTHQALCRRSILSVP
jgi:altronate dehydratase